MAGLKQQQNLSSWNFLSYEVASDLAFQLILEKMKGGSNDYVASHDKQEFARYGHSSTLPSNLSVI